MPAWTLGDICTRATTRIGRRADISLSDCTFWANQAIQDVALATEQALLEKITVSSTTSGENRVELPADVYQLINLSYLTDSGGAGSGRTLVRTSESEVDAVGFLPGARPTHYVLYENDLELWPSPNSAYSIQMRYRAYTSDLTNVADVPSLDTEYRMAALLRTEQYLHQHVGNENEAAQKGAEYFTLLSTLQDSRAKRQRAQTKSGVKLLTRKGRF